MEGAAGKVGASLRRWSGWALSAIWVERTPSQLHRQRLSHCCQLRFTQSSVLWFAVLTVGVIEKHRLGWAAVGSKDGFRIGFRYP